MQPFIDTNRTYDSTNRGANQDCFSNHFTHILWPFSPQRFYWGLSPRNNSTTIFPGPVPSQQPAGDCPLETCPSSNAEKTSPPEPWEVPQAILISAFAPRALLARSSFPRPTPQRPAPGTLGAPPPYPLYTQTKQGVTKLCAVFNESKEDKSIQPRFERKLVVFPT